MGLFAPIYARALVWAGHHRAPGFLAAMSAAESVIFPVPPDVMLVPMTLAQPQHWRRFALICTIASLFGGLLGYVLGSYLLDALWPWIERLGWAGTFMRVQGLFTEYGFWIVFVAGFTPIPYKIFTLASGATGIGLLPFIVGSLVGRGARFFLVAGLIAWGGERLQRGLQRYIEWLGWAVAVVLVALALWLEWQR